MLKCDKVKDIWYSFYIEIRECEDKICWKKE